MKYSREKVIAAARARVKESSVVHAHGEAWKRGEITFGKLVEVILDAATFSADEEAALAGSLPPQDLDMERTHSMFDALIISARRWWLGKRPVGWSEELHLQRPAVNAVGPNEADLAIATANIAREYARLAERKNAGR